MVSKMLVHTSDGVGHRARETDGDCHLTVCGKFVHGRLAVITPAARVCLDCVQRLDNPVIRSEPEEAPAAVRKGKGHARRARRGPHPKGAPFE